MTIGTRVYHRRYPWMVGTIRGVYGPTVFVHWEHDSFPGRTQQELPEDLRATPIQP